jgi:dTDP-4-dehydrorhamnose reductase
MKVLVIGATGMLGYSLFSNLSQEADIDVYGTVRNIEGKEKYFTGKEEQLFTNVDVSNLTSVENVISELKPNFVLNCIGLIKQYDSAKIPVEAIKTNSLLPHQLASLCDKYQSKLIHFSTDCVFSGSKGEYLETDTPNATDIYGRSKLLGEVYYGNHLTLRTSIIGHELTSNVSLVDWFLSQQIETKGFSKAIFSGLPTCYVAKVLVNYVFNNNLNGLYHLSVKPIDKYTLLNKIARQYSKDIIIHESNDLIIDRSLNSENFQTVVDFNLPNWDELIEIMHADYVKQYK